MFHPGHHRSSVRSLLAAVLISGSASCAAMADVDLGQAVDIARGRVANAAAIESKLDNRSNRGPVIKVDLVASNGRTAWEVKINPVTGEVRSVERDDEDDQSDIQENLIVLDMIGDANLDFSDALVVAANRYPTREPWKIEFDIEHGRLVYQISMQPQGNESRFRLRVDAITGHIYYDEGDNQGDSSISLLDAISLGELAALRGDAIKVEVEREHGQSMLKVEVAKRRGRSRTNVALDSSTGRVMDLRDDNPRSRERRSIRREVDALRNANLNWADALTIARNEVSNGRPIEMELEFEHRRLWYQVKFRTNRGTERILVNAQDGSTRRD